MINVMSRFYASVYNLIMVFAASSPAARNCNSCVKNQESRRCNPSLPPQSDNSVPQNSLVPNEPSQISADIPAQKPRSRCCPYDFDGNICKTVDDRLLCGYNRNVGNPKTKESVVHLHGGCRLRGGRLECGYEHGPYTNPRRPPIWNDAQPPSDYDDEPLPKKDSYESDDKLIMLKNNVSLNTPSPIRAVTRCVEIADRIVCRKL